MRLYGRFPQHFAEIAPLSLSYLRLVTALRKQNLDHTPSTRTGVLIARVMYLFELASIKTKTSILVYFAQARKVIKLQRDKSPCSKCIRSR